MARKSRKNTPIFMETAPDEIVYNAAAYTRVSGDDNRKPGDSLENQRDIIENYISTMPDIRLAQVYTDNYATGTNFERQAFKQMLADIEGGRINCIIVKDLSRFGRNAIDACKLSCDNEIHCLQQLQDSIGGHGKNYVSNDSAVKSAKEMIDAKELTQEITDLLIEKVLVYPAGKLEVVWKVEVFVP